MLVARRCSAPCQPVHRGITGAFAHFPHVRIRSFVHPLVCLPCHSNGRLLGDLRVRSLNRNSNDAVWGGLAAPERVVSYGTEPTMAAEELWREAATWLKNLGVLNADSDVFKRQSRVYDLALALQVCACFMLHDAQLLGCAMMLAVSGSFQHAAAQTRRRESSRFQDACDAACAAGSCVQCAMHVCLSCFAVLDSTCVPNHATRRPVLPLHQAPDILGSVGLVVWPCC